MTKTKKVMLKTCTRNRKINEKIVDRQVQETVK